MAATLTGQLATKVQWICTLGKTLDSGKKIQTGGECLGYVSPTLAVWALTPFRPVCSFDGCGAIGAFYSSFTFEYDRYFVFVGRVVEPKAIERPERKCVQMLVAMPCHVMTLGEQPEIGWGKTRGGNDR